MSKNTLNTKNAHNEPRGRPTWLQPAMACLVLVLWATPVAAQSGLASPAPPAGAPATTGGWTVTLDDQPLAAERPPIPASIDTLLVSARSVFQALGAQLQVDPSGRIQVTRSGLTLVMHEGQTTAELNGNRTKVPVAPRREGGTLMVPLPFVAQALGYGARWDYQARALAMKTMSSGGSPPPAATASVRAAAYPSTLGAALPTLQNPTGGTFPPTTASVPPVTTGSTPSSFPGMPPGMAIGYPGATPASVGYPTAAPPSPSAYPGSSVPSGYPSGTIPMEAGMPATMTIPPATTPPQMATTTQSFPSSEPAPATPALPSMQMGPISPPGGAEALWKDNNTYNPTRNTSGMANPPMPANSSIAGTMDPVVPSAPDGWFDPSAIERNDGPDNRPDASLTGLTLERLFVSMFSTYRVRYRLGNVGKGPVESPVIIRLFVGSERMGGGMQAVQDVKVDRLNPGEFRDFEWIGDSVKHPFLNNMVIRAKAVLIQQDDTPDGSSSNNSRSVVISY